jgi:hypothetical protein
MGIGAAHKRHLDHPWHFVVGDKPSLPLEERFIFLAGESGHDLIGRIVAIALNRFSNQLCNPGSLRKRQRMLRQAQHERKFLS